MPFSNGEVLFAGSLNNTWRSIGSIVISANATTAELGGISGFPLGEFNIFRITGRLLFSGPTAATFSPRLLVNNTNATIGQQAIDTTTVTNIAGQGNLISPLVSSGMQAHFEAYVTKAPSGGVGSHLFKCQANEMSWVQYHSWGYYPNNADIGSFLIESQDASFQWRSGTSIYFEGKSQ